MGHILFCRKLTFEASHYYRLFEQSEEDALQQFGQVSKCHEHQWELTVWLRGPVHSETGMIMDLLEVDAILQKHVLEPFGGRIINHQDPFFLKVMPTTEVLAGYFAQKLAPHFLPVVLTRLRLAETSDLYAEWHV